jgi:glycosyltransferase involved in cell wall biosynthesis
MHKKKIIFIDDFLGKSFPAASSFASAVPLLVERGWEIEAWCNGVDDNLIPYIKYKKLPMVKGIPVLGNVFNWGIRNIIGGLRWLRCSNKDKTVFLSSGGHFIFADILTFHFYNKSWFNIQKKGIERGFESPLRRYFQLWGIFEDWTAFVSPFVRKYLPVSDAIADDLRRDYPESRIDVLANTIDLACFDYQIRDSKRESLREEFGFTDNEIVLLFISQGHYARKGFWLAVKSLHRMRESGVNGFRIVVLGGKTKKLEKIRDYLTLEYPGWESWLSFVGYTSKVPQYMAAADALFFPSYFEAFSLVEIEAAAMKLPLILTRHHGSEMILVDGVNGYECGFEPESIEKTLLKLRDDPIEMNRIEIGKALDAITWAKKLDDHMRLVLEEKNDHN